MFVFVFGGDVVGDGSLYYFVQLLVFLLILIGGGD